MSSNSGLATDIYSWLLYGAMLAVWGGGLFLIPHWHRLRFGAVPMSLFGYVWVGFGAQFVLRFPLLCWDSFAFGNMTARLADASADQVNLALAMSALYFAVFTLAYGLALAFTSRLKLPPLEFPAEKSQQGRIVLWVLALAASALTAGVIPLPSALLTPLGIFGMLWLLPAAYIWFERFRFSDRPKSLLAWVVLLPAIMRAVLSPYRENLLIPVVIVVVAAAFGGRRIRFGLMVFVVSVGFLVATITIGSYRLFLWENAGVVDARQAATSGYTINKQYDAKWVEALRRFSAFDSLLLTVRYVPEFMPYSKREVLISGFVRGLIPRVLNPNKEGDTRGVEFGQSIWTYEEPESRNSEAVISPSMPGDLYEIYGPIMVAVGATVWGFLVGALEGWKLRLSPMAQVALISFLAFHLIGSVERDYAHVISTTVQWLIVLYLASKIAGLWKPPEMTRPANAAGGRIK